MCNLLNTVFSSKEPFIGWNFYTSYASTQEVKISKSDNPEKSLLRNNHNFNSLSISPLALFSTLEQKQTIRERRSAIKQFSFKWKQINQVNPEDTGSFSVSMPHFFQL